MFETPSLKGIGGVATKNTWMVWTRTKKAPWGTVALSLEIRWLVICLPLKTGTGYSKKKNTRTRKSTALCLRTANSWRETLAFFPSCPLRWETCSTTPPPPPHPGKKKPFVHQTVDIILLQWACSQKGSSQYISSGQQVFGRQILLLGNGKKLKPKVVMLAFEVCMVLITPPKFNIEFAPSKWWLEDDPFLFFGDWDGLGSFSLLFVGNFCSWDEFCAVSFWENNSNLCNLLALAILDPMSGIYPPPSNSGTGFPEVKNITNS